MQPSSHPARENAYGNARAPAPSVALHKLNTEPRTLPSRNHEEKASLESNILKNGVCGGENGFPFSSKFLDIKKQRFFLFLGPASLIVIGAESPS